MNKDQAKEALIRAGRIIDQWERQGLDSQEAMEMLAAEFGTISLYFELELGDAETKEGDLKEEKEEEAASHVENVDPAAAISDPNLGAEEYEVESERLQEVEGDLFSKTESKEEENEDVKKEEKGSKSKSKSKKPKRFAGDDGEIPF